MTEQRGSVSSYVTVTNDQTKYDLGHVLGHKSCAMP